MPKQIQLKRQKGLAHAAQHRERGAPKQMGNPFRVFEYGREGAIEKYREWLVAKDLSELRGKNLACYCPLDQACHADVLLKLANE
jgi:Domain of unknown function (DUF4326)